MNTMLTILGVVAGAILLVVFGLGAVAAVAHSFFRFLKGVFRIGFEASKEGRGTDSISSSRDILRRDARPGASGSGTGLDNARKPGTLRFDMRRSILQAAVAALALTAAAASATTRVYSGHYASGTAVWTIKDGRVYRGHYASGAAAYTIKDGRVYAGHYASGAAIFTWKDGRLYRGHYASGAAAYTIKDGRVYAGHYASGAAAGIWKDGRLYRGHYASGTAAATLSGDDAPDDMTLVFLAVLSGI